MWKRWLRILVPQILITGVAVALCVIFLPKEVKVSRIDFILNALMTCASTFTGFTLTIISLLLSFVNSPVMTYLNNAGGTAELRARYTLSVVMGVLLIVLLLVVGGVVKSDNVLRRPWVVLGVCATTVYFYNLVNSGWYLLRTLTKATTPPPVKVDETPMSPKGTYKV